MLALIEEARRRQRRRRAGLALTALVLAAVGGAGFLSTRHGGSSGVSSIIRARSQEARAMVAGAAAAQALHRGQRVTVVELDPKTGAVVVRLTTSH